MTEENTNNSEKTGCPDVSTKVVHTRVETREMKTQMADDDDGRIIYALAADLITEYDVKWDKWYKWAKAQEDLPEQQD